MSEYDVEQIARARTMDFVTVRDEVLRLSAEGMIAVDIALELGVSPQRVSQILRPRANAAQSAVKRALDSGRLVRPGKCESCGESGRPIEAHPEDYRKPLEVCWLCRPCHSARHSAIYAGKAGGPGIVCPTCGTHCDCVKDTRHGPGYVRRRRICRKCGWRVSTAERIEAFGPGRPAGGMVDDGDTDP